MENYYLSANRSKLVHSAGIAYRNQICNDDNEIQTFKQLARLSIDKFYVRGQGSDQVYKTTEGSPIEMRASRGLYDKTLALQEEAHILASNSKRHLVSHWPIRHLQNLEDVKKINLQNSNKYHTCMPI